MYRRLFAFIVGIALIPALCLPHLLSAQTEVDKLQKDIQERSTRLIEIEREITKFNEDLKKVGAEKNTLQKAINQLELERKKLGAEISKTQNQISSTDLEINKLILEIDRTKKEITKVSGAVAETVRSLYKNDDQSLILLLLQTEKLSEFWGSFEAHENVRNSMVSKVEELSTFKKLMDEKRDSTTQKRSSLVSLKNQYSDQTEVLANNRIERTKLLEVTKSEERTYQQLLSDRKKARDLIVKELRDFESKLSFILDPNTIPASGSRVFDWPLKKIVITQYFGGSEFAKRNPGIYGGRAYHPGVDFGTPRGTPIYAPLSGTVRATGNTDAVPGCFSWGKWTLVDHPNGLSTLYAHQDVVSVTAGQKVATGEIIGYTGNTGFSTGPHLHFTVYVKAGVTVRQFNEIKTVTSCGPASTPVAATEAYVDPMLYLPIP